MPNNFDRLFNQSQGDALINALKGIKSSLDVNYPLENINVNFSNTAQNITPSSNYYGIGQVNVPALNIVDETILLNGQYDPVTSGYDGYGKLNVNVPNTYGASDEGKVVDNSALVSQTSQNITENGTYDTTLKNEVVVSVSGGGNIPVISEADWEEMTTEEKQAYGLCVIQTATTGFERGIYVNGADYSAIDPNWSTSDSGVTLCTLNGRAYVKKNAGLAFIAYFYYSGGYSGPLLISTDPDAVTYTMGGRDYSSIGTLTYDNVLYYYSNTSDFNGGNITSTSGIANKLSDSGMSFENARILLIQKALREV